MYPSTFEYVRAESVAEAVDLLETYDEAELLAGGQSLVPLQKTRFASPDQVIDLGGIDGLDYLTEDGEYIRIGAMTRHTTAERSDLIVEHVPLFSECISQIADWQVRNQGTVGGTVAEADPNGDYFPPLKLLNPDVVVQGPDGERVVSFEDFYLGMFTVDLEHAELITEVRLPKVTPVEGAVAVGSTYKKHAERSGDYAIVGVAAIVHVDDEDRIVEANVSVGGVGPLFVATEAEAAVEGTKLDDDALEKAGELVDEEALADIGGREGQYQEKMASVFTKRALQAAYENATEQQ